MIHLVLDASTAIDWFVLTPEGEGYSRHLTTLAASGQVRFSVPLHFDVEASLNTAVAGDRFEIRIVLPYRRQA